MDKETEGIRIPSSLDKLSGEFTHRHNTSRPLTPGESVPHLYTKEEWHTPQSNSVPVTGLGEEDLDPFKNMKEKYEPKTDRAKAFADQYKKPEGLRFNSGKIRYDLFEPFAIEQLAKVFTKGANKYEDRNWEKGMKWSKMIASGMRHIQAFLKGEDYDFDPNCEGCKAGNCTNHTGLLHTALASWNLMGLTSFYKIFPQGDDRRHNYLSMPKIGLDIDEVICDWTGAWVKKFGYDIPECWNFSYSNKQHFDSFSPEELDEFYLNIPAKIKPNEIPFEPHCYITSRSVPVELTQKWIQKHGFPTVPIYSVGFGVSKIEVAKKSGIDWFVDDRFENFVELNNAGICTFLLTAPHNKRYNVGYKRISSLKELFDRANG